MRAQNLHHGGAIGRANLQHRAQLFVKQRFERQLISARAHLASPVFAVAHIGAAVRDAVALGHEHVDIHRHAHMPGKRHLAHSGKQAAIAAVVVGQHLALTAQDVHGFHQIHQVFGVVQVRHFVAQLAQGLRQDAAAHAVFATTQIDQYQRGVIHRVELRREGAAHIDQGGKGGDDQRHRRGHFFSLTLVFPGGPHR